MSMTPISPGSAAPGIHGLEPNGPQAIVFYKVTCPVCHLAAPKLGDFAKAFPGRVRGVGQDPPENLSDFERRFGMEVGSVPDLPPYEASNAYGVRTVPTTFLIDADGAVDTVVEGWDRDGLNQLSTRLAGMTNLPDRPVSEPGDGLPSYRPG